MYEAQHLQSFSVKSFVFLYLNLTSSQTVQFLEDFFVNVNFRVIN